MKGLKNKLEQINLSIELSKGKSDNIHRRELLKNLKLQKEEITKTLKKRK